MPGSSHQSSQGKQTGQRHNWASIIAGKLCLSAASATRYYFSDMLLDVAVPFAICPVMRRGSIRLRTHAHVFLYSTPRSSLSLSLSLSLCLSLSHFCCYCFLLFFVWKTEDPMLSPHSVLLGMSTVIPQLLSSLPRRPQGIGR